MFYLYNTVMQKTDQDLQTKLARIKKVFNDKKKPEDYQEFIKDVFQNTYNFSNISIEVKIYLNITTWFLSILFLLSISEAIFLYVSPISSNIETKIR